MIQHSAGRRTKHRSTVTGGRNIRLAACLSAALCLLMSGCNQKKITIFYPCTNADVQSQLDMVKVRQVFQAATRQVLAELKKKPAFEHLQINFQVPEAGFTRSIEIEGPNILEKIAEKEEVNGVMYTIITQPFKIPYCDSEITFHLAKSAVQTYQSHGVLMDYNTFYQIEFWKAELVQIMMKIEGAL